jgi:hypothetical protein
VVWEWLLELLLFVRLLAAVPAMHSNEVDRVEATLVAALCLYLGNHNGTRKAAASDI